MKMRDLMKLVESAGDDFDGYLYHAAPSRHVDAIRSEGIQPGYWGTHVIAAYYADDIQDNGDEPRIFKAPLAAFDEAHMAPDQPGIDEPLTYTLGMSEEEVWSTWASSKKTWRDSLEIIGSVRYNAVIPPNAIRDA